MSSAPTPGYHKNEVTAFLERGAAAHAREARLRYLTRSSPGVGQVLSDRMTALFAGCDTFEWVALSYLLISSVLIAIFAESLAHPVRLLSVQGLVALLSVALCNRTGCARFSAKIAIS